jgi:hypothetical protein
MLDSIGQILAACREQTVTFAVILVWKWHKRLFQPSICADRTFRQVILLGSIFILPVLVQRIREYVLIHHDGAHEVTRPTLRGSVSWTAAGSAAPRRFRTHEMFSYPPCAPKSAVAAPALPVQSIFGARAESPECDSPDWSESASEGPGNAS